MGGGEGERHGRTMWEGGSAAEEGRGKGELPAGSMERTREKACWRTKIQLQGPGDVSRVSTACSHEVPSVPLGARLDHLGARRSPPT